MNKVKIISYYTNTGIYPEFVKRLKDSCERFSLPYEIRRRDDQGSWVDNCNYKINYIIEQLQITEENECLVWIDADARLMQHPYLFMVTDKDFGIRAEPGGRKKIPAGREEIELPKNWPYELNPAWFNSGTIFLRKNNIILKLCEEWLNLKQQSTRSWDQWTLQQAWCNIKPNTEWFPREYCQINKLHGMNKAVVLHDLASTMQKVNRK
jgi:hypothetical protein